MNQGGFIKQIPEKLTELKTTFEGGLPITSVDLTDVKNNTSDIASNTSIVALCVDQVNHHVEVDTNAINGVTMAVNSGNLSNGTQRVSIATNDVNLAAINTNAATTATLLNGWVGGYVPGMNVSLRGIHFGAGDETIAAASGNVTNGTLRVTVAENDLNIAAQTAYLNTTQDKLGFIDTNINTINTNIGTINTNLATMNTTLTNLYNLFNDIYNSSNHYIRTHETA